MPQWKHPISNHKFSNNLGKKLNDKDVFLTIKNNFYCYVLRTKESKTGLKINEVFQTSIYIFSE